MRQKRLRQSFAQFIINGGTTGRHTITATISAECSEERAVRRTRVYAMQTVDDVQSLFVGFQCLDGLRKFGLRQRSAAGHAFRNTGLRIKTLVLHEENNSLRSRAAGGRCQETFRKKRCTECSADTGRYSLKHVSAIEHDRSFDEIDGQLSYRCLTGLVKVHAEAVLLCNTFHSGKNRRSRCPRLEMCGTGKD